MTSITELAGFLASACKQDDDLLNDLVTSYLKVISKVDNNKLLQLQDLLVNSFGDD